MFKKDPFAVFQNGLVNDLSPNIHYQGLIISCVTKGGLGSHMPPPHRKVVPAGDPPLNILKNYIINSPIYVLSQSHGT